MDDRQLLEAAAKATGITLPGPDDHDEIGRSYVPALGLWVSCHNGHWQWWSPLTDDGDALRLAVRLNIGVQSHAGRGDYSLADEGAAQHVELHGDDPYAATRRAIVRAAAAIGAKHG